MQSPFKCTTPIAAPNITSISPTTQASPGADVTLECVITGFPSPNITWTKDTISFIEGILAPVVPARGSVVNSQIDDTTINSLLFISQITSDDAGIYTCVATNSEGVDYDEVEVIVAGEKLLQMYILYNIYIFNTNIFSLKHHLK